MIEVCDSHRKKDVKGGGKDCGCQVNIKTDPE